MRIRWFGNVGDEAAESDKSTAVSRGQSSVNAGRVRAPIGWPGSTCYWSRRKIKLGCGISPSAALDGIKIAPATMGQRH